MSRHKDFKLGRRPWGKPNWNLCRYCRRPVAIAEIEAGTAVCEPTQLTLGQKAKVILPAWDPLRTDQAHRFGLKIARELKRLRAGNTIEYAGGLIGPMLQELARVIEQRVRTRITREEEAKTAAPPEWQTPYHVRCKEEIKAG